ncbi:MAG: AMP-binding protein, partial [Candidatus Obscuribacterales bacterium]|nr:AMP-binding protein [Steroidobacteraceae bacterium]
MTKHIWEKSYAPPVSWDFPLPAPQPVQKILQNAAAQWPDRVGLDFYDRTFTYKELLLLASRVATGLQALGVGPGVHVGLHIVNSPHYLLCFFGVLLAGGRVVNCSPLAARRELEYQLADAEVQILITMGLPALYQQASVLKGKARLRKLVICRLEDFVSTELSRSLVGAGLERSVTADEVEFAKLIDNDGCFTPHPLGPLVDEVAV